MYCVKNERFHFRHAKTTGFVLGIGKTKGFSKKQKLLKQESKNKNKTKTKG